MLLVRDPAKSRPSPLLASANSRSHHWLLKNAKPSLLFTILLSRLAYSTNASVNQKSQASSTSHAPVCTPRSLQQATSDRARSSLKVINLIQLRNQDWKLAMPIINQNRSGTHRNSCKLSLTCHKFINMRKGQQTARRHCIVLPSTLTIVAASPRQDKNQTWRGCSPAGADSQSSQLSAPLSFDEKPSTTTIFTISLQNSTFYTHIAIVTHHLSIR